MNGWIGVDLDGTLAHYDGWVDELHIGTPIASMVARIKLWISQDREVRIFTARVAEVTFNPDGTLRDISHIRRAIEDYTELHIGKRLQVTNMKDYGMIELWDDRAVQIILNTGRRADGKE